MTGLRVKDVLRLYEGEPGGVEAIPVGLWWTLKERSVIFSNESIPVLSMLVCENTTSRQWSRDGMRLLGC